ncbi:MAG: di-trans,poly-cis-decaprenylcistransferase, partial [Gammaproteobacteria bacterium]|nr:di-trans,poly-cis-decaprenylcistransferase [Gammaproteobacteria bacterium]
MTTALPRHIAVVMDGNGRWAKARFLPRKMGHHAGGKTVRALVEQCARRGIEVLTLFAFSSENWQRPAEEVAVLMQLFFESLEKELPSLIEQQIRLRVIGDRSLLSPELQQRIGEAEAKTASYSKMNLVLAVSYGGRWDIIQATKELA